MGWREDRRRPPCRRGPSREQRGPGPRRSIRRTTRQAWFAYLRAKSDPGWGAVAVAGLPFGEGTVKEHNDSHESNQYQDPERGREACLPEDHPIRDDRYWNHH